MGVGGNFLQLNFVLVVIFYVVYNLMNMHIRLFGHFVSYYRHTVFYKLIRRRDVKGVGDVFMNLMVVNYKTKAHFGVALGVKTKITRV